MNAINTAALTLLGGIVLFVVNQWMQKFFFEPLHEQRKAIGEVDFLLIYWAWAFASPDDWEKLTCEQRELREKAAQALREAASKLVATTHAVRGYWLAWGAPTVPSVRAAAGHLIAMSGSVFAPADSRREEALQNRESAKEARKLLKLPVDPPGV